MSESKKLKPKIPMSYTQIVNSIEHLLKACYCVFLEEYYLPHLWVSFFVVSLKDGKSLCNLTAEKAKVVAGSEHLEISFYEIFRIGQN